MENQHLSWVNPLFLWQCSLAKCSLTRPGIHHKPKNRDSDRQHFILGKSSISGRISSHVSWIGWLVDVRPVFVVLETNLGVMICKLCVFSGQYVLQGVTSIFDHVFKVISMCWFHIIWVAVVLPFYHPLLLIHFHGLPWISPCFAQLPLGHWSSSSITLGEVEVSNPWGYPQLSSVLYKVVPPSYKLVFKSINYR